MAEGERKIEQPARAAPADISHEDLRRLRQRYANHVLETERLLLRVLTEVNRWLQPGRASIRARRMDEAHLSHAWELEWSPHLTEVHRVRVEMRLRWPDTATLVVSGQEIGTIAASHDRLEEALRQAFQTQQPVSPAQPEQAHEQ